MVRPESKVRKQVQLTVFDNEPEAKMAEQLLAQEGIPCLTKSLGGGPGLWGSAYNLPHGVYVHEENVARARELLGINVDDESSGNRSADGAGSQSNWLWIAIVLLIVATLILAGSTLRRLFGI
jgi:hypothetical protein